MRANTVETVSLDEPVRADSGDPGGAMADFIPDEAAGEAFGGLLDEDIARAILDEARRLPGPTQSLIIFECVYGGRSLASFAESAGASRQNIASQKESAIAWLRQRPAIRAMRDEFFRDCEAARRESAADPYRAKGAALVADIRPRLMSWMVMALAPLFGATKNSRFVFESAAASRHAIFGQAIDAKCSISAFASVPHSDLAVSYRPDFAKPSERYSLRFISIMTDDTLLSAR
jgi:hypothetical protein